MSFQKNFLISLILTVKNGMPYLPEAINSLRNQTYKNFELIVQDGASSDGSFEYLKGVNDIPGFSLESGPDSGSNEGSNKCFHRAKGDLIGSIDADNILANNS